MTAALDLSRIGHRYGAVPAVRDVSLALNPGEVVCLVGPSGCGKSTLLRLAAGLETLQHGQVSLNGIVVAEEDGAQLPPEKRRIGLVFQDYALFPHLSVIDNIAFGLDGLPKAERIAIAETWLGRIGLGSYSKAFPHALSGGQQQRVALARALAPSPKVLLLDEPFSGLDASLRDGLREETLGLLKETGAATLMVTHDPEEAMLMADRLALMQAGRIEQLGRPIDLYARPSSAFTASFFGGVNRFEAACSGGAIETPLGRLPAPLGCDGRVEVFVRHEAVHLTAAPEGQPAAGQVLDSRTIGRATIVRLAVPGLAQPLTARIPGYFHEEAGATVGLMLDQSRIHVFPLAA